MTGVHKIAIFRSPQKGSGRRAVTSSLLIKGFDNRVAPSARPIERLLFGTGWKQAHAALDEFCTDRNLEPKLVSPVRTVTQSF